MPWLSWEDSSSVPEPGQFAAGELNFEGESAAGEPQKGSVSHGHCEDQHRIFSKRILKASSLTGVDAVAVNPEDDSVPSRKVHRLLNNCVFCVGADVWRRSGEEVQNET